MDEPNRIGGLRMVSELIRPHAVSFLDQMLRESTGGLRVESTPIKDGSKLDGATLGEVRQKAPRELLLLAITDNGEWHFNPPSSLVLATGMSLVYMGTPDTRAALADN